jgi:predicted Zn-dependent protease
VQAIPPPDSHHVSAALGWLGLGDLTEARAELAKVSRKNRHHPAVLEARWAVSAQAKDWRKALAIAQTELDRAPEESSGWLHRAYALRRVKGGGLAQAWDALLPAAGQFPDEPVIPYNLACYACQMQQFEVAWEWLHRAVAAGKKDFIKNLALTDDDLKPLWPEIKKL